MRFSVFLIPAFLFWSNPTPAAGPVFRNTASDCRLDLRPGAVYRLGIGVLAEGQDGALNLGISPYAGSVHTAIVQELAGQTGIKQILWMGELRYRVVDGVPVLFEANETSGHYLELKQSGLALSGRSVPVQNSVDNLPLELRTADFKGFVFNPSNMRLARELQNISGDIRHSIGNSLQVLSSVTQLLAMPRPTAEKKREMLDGFLVKHTSDLALVNWLVLNLFEEERLNAAESSLMFGLLRAYSRKEVSIDEVASTDLNALDQVMQKISRMINPHMGQTPVQIFRLR